MVMDGGLNQNIYTVYSFGWTNEGDAMRKDAHAVIQY